MTRTVWELLICHAHVKRVGLLAYNQRTPYFLPWIQVIRYKMWTWTKYHNERNLLCPKTSCS